MSRTTEPRTDPSPLATAVADALRVRCWESTAHEEMCLIRFRMAQGLADADELLHYRALWVALSLHRSPSCRPRLDPRIVAATAACQAARAALEDEHARAAIESAFCPEDDAPMEGAASQPV
jgi:hypothetical protein